MRDRIAVTANRPRHGRRFDGWAPKTPKVTRSLSAGKEQPASTGPGVAKEQPGRLASWRSRLPLVPRHTPAAASRTSPVRSSGGEAPFGESLCPGACVGLYDAHKSRGQQCRVSSCAGYGCCLGVEETLDVDRWRLRLSATPEITAAPDWCRRT